MSEHFNPFIEQEDDDEEVPAVVEQAPQDEEQTFFERVREILHLDDTEEDDDDEEETPRHRSVFRRLFARVPGVVSISKAETQPEEVSEQPREHSFSLPFVEVAGDVEEVILHTVNHQPDVIDPEPIIPQPLFEQEIPPETIGTYEDEVIAAAEPIAAVEIEELVTEYYFEPVAVTEVNQTEDQMGEQPTRQDTKKIADKAAKRAAAKVAADAKRREHKIANESKKRDKALAKEIGALQQENNTLEEQLRQRLQIEQAAVPEVLAAAERPVVSAPAPREERQPVIPSPVSETAATTENILESPKLEEPTRVGERLEPYNPEHHDNIPPQEAFEELTGMEVPPPRNLEQERRFEVKDDPGVVPAQYTQAVSSPGASAPPAVAPQSNRGALVGLGPSTDHHAPSKPVSSPQSVYKQAVVSGVVTAIVLLAIAIVATFFF